MGDGGATLEGLIAQLPTGMMLVDGGGYVTQINRAAAEILGATRAGAVGRSLAALHPGLAPLSQPARRAEVRITREGEPVIVGYTATALRDAGGVVVTLSDITDERARAVAEEHERRLADLGRVVATVAHEIRNPLGAIKGAVLVVEPSMGKFDAHTKEFLDVIVEEVDRLNRVVSQFLTYSRPFAGELGAVEIESVIHATTRLLGDEDRARVQFTQGPAAPRVRGDADALRQVLHNLVLNALDATGRSVDASVGIEITRRRRGLLRADAVAVTVWDNGPGLSHQTMTNLFVPFHTTKSGGTGLGLPISQRIVENHRGVIEVGNMPDGGARFTVLLPVYDEDPPKKDASGASTGETKSESGPTATAETTSAPTQTP